MIKRGEFLLLVDGTSLVYRSYFAFIRNPLRNSRGENTSAAFAFANSLLKLLREQRPSHVALVFDAKGPTKRHEAYQSYKATRPGMPEDLSTQLGWIREIGEGLNLKSFEVPGFEADDVMAVLAKKAKEAGLKTLLVTSDKDLLQLVDEDVLVLDSRPKEEILYTREKVLEKFGVPPERIPDYLGLVGDKIDNIPGVQGVGERGARELLGEFGNIEMLFEELDRVKHKGLRSALEKGKEEAFLAKKLTQLDYTVPLTFSFEELRLTSPDRARLIEILKRLEFSGLLEEMAEFPKEVEVFEAKVLDTDSLLPGVALALEGETLFLTRENQKVFRVSLREATPILENSRLPKFVLNSKMLMREALRRRFSLNGVDFDAILADYLLEPGKSRYTLESLALEHLGFRVHTAGAERATEEVFIVRELRGKLPLLLEQRALLPLYREIELPLAEVLARMEHYGLLLDREVLLEMDASLEEELKGLEAQIYTLAGESFNINSPKQLAHILFEKLSLPPRKRTKTGYSTDSEVLQALREQHELPQKLLEYREVFKIRTTYVSSLLELRDPQTGRVHPTLSQTGTATGRLSCFEPNLQNIPVRSEIGRRLRKAFVAPKGSLLLSADYSQVELRILAHMSEDQNLLEAFRRGEDIHRKTAAALLGKPFSEVTEAERREAKAINFGIIYGMSPFGLSKELGISSEEAAGMIGSYFAAYPGVKAWIRATQEKAQKVGYVTTLLGRRRYIPETLSSERAVRELWERITVNAPIQGSAADLIKKAMVDIDREQRRAGIPGFLLLQIHDELLFEVPLDALGEMKALVKERMEGALSLKAPLPVTMGSGPNWLEAKG